MDNNLQNPSRNATGVAKNVYWTAQYIVNLFKLDMQITMALGTFQMVFYPLLAIVALPVNVLSFAILSRGNCGLSKGVTRYLVAMVAADQLVILFDLILSKIPVAYIPEEIFLWSHRVPLCNVHAVLLYAATDCSVWFTVTFTFDRFIAICFQKLKVKYCTGSAAAQVLGTVTALSCVKNIFWYFLLEGTYSLLSTTLLCFGSNRQFSSSQAATFLVTHFVFTPILPFMLILLLNILTIRHVFVASRARRRLRASRNGEMPADPEMKNRRQSLLFLLAMSGNFIILWALLTVFSVWEILRLSFLTGPPKYLREMGYILQPLSCSTNTALYAVVQSRFRAQLKETLKTPFRTLTKIFCRFQECINPQ